MLVMELAFQKKGDFMKKIVLIPDNQLQLEANIKKIDNFIIGIDKLTINVSFLCDLKNLIKIIENFPTKNFFIALNKNYQNKDLDDLKKTMKIISKYKVKGVLFYDLAVLQINETLNLKLNLIWHNEHYATNYATINAYLNNKVKGAVLSPDINLKEILEIRKKTKAALFVQVYGYHPIFNSVRNIIGNYLDFHNIKKNASNYYLRHENLFMPIIYQNEITTIYNSKLINGIKLINQLKKIDYWIINGFQLKSERLEKIIDSFINEKQFDDNSSDEVFFKETKYFIKGEKT